MFTVAETAKKLQRSLSKTYQLLKSGKIGHYRMDGAIFVTQTDIDEYLASCRVEPAGKPRRPARQATHLTLD